MPSMRPGPSVSIPSSLRILNGHDLHACALTRCGSNGWMPKSPGFMQIADGFEDEEPDDEGD